MASHEREAIFVRRLFWCMLCHEVLVGCTRRCEHIELGMGNDYGIPFVDATRLNRRFRLSGETKSRSVTARTLAEGLAQFPEMGRVGRVEGTRELVISKLPTLPHIALPATRCVYCVCCAAHNSGRTRCRKYLSRSDSSSWACWLIGLPPPGCG